MGAITEVYVDPSIAANSGTGTIGDPYGDLQYAFDTKARDATNGDRFNVKAGTAEVLTATLSLTTYGTPTSSAPLWIQGYTSAANDGGIGEISGNATYKIMAAQDWMVVRDMKVGNCGNNSIWTGGGYCVYHNVEFHGNTSTGDGVAPGAACIFVGCAFHDMEGTMLSGSRSKCYYNAFYEGAATCVAAYHTGNECQVVGNTITLKSTARGVDNDGQSNCVIVGNSIWAAASNQQGININGVNNLIMNNLIEGFSASGGEAILIGNSSFKSYFIGYNSYYNNATNINGTSYTSLGGDASLSASPFVNGAGFDLRLTPAARLRAFPNTFKGSGLATYLDQGAVQAIQSMRRSRAILIG